MEEDTSQTAVCVPLDTQGVAACTSSVSPQRGPSRPRSVKPESITTSPPDDAIVADTR
ncbi:hypothetical protein DIPPA_17246 [Diplonema papillatum]|nr:hypothetical protein DIPPA_17246 [Diplonema papillatum]